MTTSDNKSTVLALHGGLGIMTQFLGGGRYLFMSRIFCPLSFGREVLGGLDHSGKVTAGSE